MLRVYEVTQNSDLNEGRGHEITVALFEKLEDAIECAQGRGVMGVGDGNVYEVPVHDTPAVKGALTLGQIQANRKRVWGYRKNWRGKWDYGYVDNRDAPVNDPEYQEFKRLQAKFGG